MEDYCEYVPNVHFEQIPIKNLVSNQEYQRNLAVSHLRRTIENFDLYQINPVKVSRRDGVNYVFNGQHTIEVIATVSGSRETPVWCMIYDDLEYSQEADIFANQMKCIKPLLPYEVFMANVEAGNDDQLVIKSLVESYGMFLSQGKVPGGICAIACLEHIYHKYGFHVLDRTLRLCIGTWEGDYHSLSANMLNGIAQMVAAFGDSMKDDLFKEKVGVSSAREISRTAKERKAGSRGYTESMLLLYNKKMKAGLQWSKLYQSQSAAPEEDFDVGDKEGAENTEKISPSGCYVFS